jgi:hypothetical protein
MSKSTHIEFDILEKRSSTGPFERIHSDVHGPSDKLSLGKNKYSVIFVCDFTGQRYVYFAENMQRTCREHAENMQRKSRKDGRNICRK